MLGRDLPPVDARAGLGYLLGFLVVAVLVAATARDLRLGLYVVAGTLGTALACLLATRGLLLLLSRLERLPGQTRGRGTPYPDGGTRTCHPFRIWPSI